MVEDEVYQDMGDERSDFDDSEGNLYMTKKNRNQIRIDAIANKYDIPEKPRAQTIVPQSRPLKQ